jgi:hypothetical protein
MGELNLGSYVEGPLSIICTCAVSIRAVVQADGCRQYLPPTGPSKLPTAPASHHAAMPRNSACQCNEHRPKSEGRGLEPARSAGRPSIGRNLVLCGRLRRAARGCGRRDLLASICTAISSGTFPWQTLRMGGGGAGGAVRTVAGLHRHAGGRPTRPSESVDPLIRLPPPRLLLERRVRVLR